MKKIFVLFAAYLCAVQVSHAQTQKGTQTLGGNLSLANSTIKQQSVNTATNMLELYNLKSTSILIGPSYSYFISDNLELGGSLSYSKGTYTNSSNVSGSASSLNQSSHSFGESVSLRKYFMFENKVGFRTGPYISYFSGNTSSTLTPVGYYNSAGKNNTFNAGANFDLVYYPSKAFGVSATFASLTYSHNKQTSPATPQESNVVENFGLNFMNTGLTVAVFYVFGGK